MQVIMQLNTFANMCGHFFNCNMEPGYKDKPNVNNGYNCDHPDCGDADEGIGKCLASACPLAFPADGLDCQKAGMTHEECEDCGREDCECEEDYMICEIPESEFDERYMWRCPQEEA